MNLPPVPEPRLTSDAGHRLRCEQVKLLYAGIPLSALATVVNAAVLVGIEWGTVGHPVLLGWLGCILFLTLLRYLLTLAYRRARPAADQNAVWERLFLIGSVTAGILWGSTSLLVFPENSLAHQVFLAFIVGGMAAGAVSALSSMRFPVFSFLLLAVGPLVLRFLTAGTEMTQVMGVMLLLFSVMLAFSANRIYLNIRQNIELRMQTHAGVNALAESEERFRELFEGNKIVQLILDPADGRILEANNAAAAFYGYSRKQLQGMNIFDVNTLSREQIQAEMELAGLEERDHFLFKHRLADGAIRDVEVHSGPIRWKEQRVLYSIIHDVSERKHAESVVGKTSKILEMVASGVQVERIYDAICRMHEEMHPGMRAAILRLQGKQLFYCSAPSLPAEYCQAIDGMEIGPRSGSCGTAAFLGKTVIVEDIAADSRWEDHKADTLPQGVRACWSEPVVGSDGKIIGTFAMCFDHVTGPDSRELVEIRNASRLVAIVMEKEQRESLLLKLSRAIEQAGESVIITDRQGTIEYVNPSFTRITGYSEEDVIGKNPRMLKSGLQSDEYYTRMWQALSGGQTWQSTIVDRRKDGTEYPALMTISPIRDSAGVISHYVGIQQDMTEHEQLEERFHQAQKMEALGTLVGGIAHDFNNMLAGMTGNLYLARKKVEDRPDITDKLDNVVSLSFRASEMIKQLLTFARKSHVDMQPFGLTTFLKEASKLSEASIPENIRFDNDFCPDELVVRGDATQLQQVVMNLLNNARDAVEGVPAPRIHMRLEDFMADQAFIDNHPELNARLLAHLSITDNGSGIRDEDLMHIFEPFYTTKEVGRGTGLGLAMAYGAVRSHGGVIEVKSNPGGGTAVHVYLPMVEEKAMTSLDKAGTDLVTGHGELILVVDDNANVRDVATEVLQAIGYRVLEASDGLEAVERFTEHRKDIALVIMDVVMPRLGGVEAAERIRMLEPGARIVFATGYDMEELSNSQMPSDNYVTLSKPYNIEELSKVISEQL